MYHVSTAQEISKPTLGIIWYYYGSEMAKYGSFNFITLKGQSQRIRKKEEIFKLKGRGFYKQVMMDSQHKNNFPSS